MKALTIALAIALLSACAKVDKRESYFKDTSYELFEPTTALKARLYLIHGLRSSKSLWHSEPFATFVTELQAKGMQVITFSLPYATQEMFLDGGQAYGSDYQRFLLTLSETVNTEHGLAPHTFIGGISFGGLHAMMGISLLPDEFEAYFAHLPVTSVQALAEFPLYPNDRFSPFAHEELLASKPGRIAWGNQDMRVDYRLTQRLAEEINSYHPTAVEFVEIAGISHTSRPQDLTDIANWIGALP